MMNQQELKNVLEFHRKWVVGEEDGSRADLRRADLRRAVLRRADLSGADLSGADLSGAVLSGADLRRAVLRRADLRRADLDPIKEDFFKVLAAAKGEALGLYDALMRGLVDGTQYEGECACLVGTVANIRHENYQKLSIDLRPDSSRPAEKWFLAIQKGDLPQNNPVSAITAEWMREWMDKEGVKYPRYEIMRIEQ